MAKITLDGHEITKLVLNPATGASVTKNLVATNSFGSSDEGKVVSNGALKAQSSQSISENGTYDTTDKNSVVVDVQSSISVDDWDIYGKELVKTWSDTFNLATDTDFDSQTPSTSWSTITPNRTIGQSFDVDFTNYRYMVVRESYIKARYDETPASGAFDSVASFNTWFLCKTEIGISSVANLGIASVPFYYNSSGTPVGQSNGGGYGITFSGTNDTPSYAASNTDTTTVSVGTPRFGMRGSQTFAPPSTLSDINSSNSRIEVRYTVYRMPINTLIGKMQTEAQYAHNNDGLRDLT